MDQMSCASYGCVVELAPACGGTNLPPAQQQANHGHDHAYIPAMWPRMNSAIPPQTFSQLRGAGEAPMSFMTLVREVGFLRMWRGAGAVALACIPSHACYFSVYEYSKAKLGVNQPGHHPIAAAAVGAAATVTHDAVLTPMDVVKQRLQLGYYRGIWHCLRTMVAQEGLAALWRSYPTTLAMNVPYASAAVSTMETTKKWLRPDGKYTTLDHFLSGAAAGAVAASVTNPMDVVKTRLQTQNCQKPICVCASPTASSAAVLNATPIHPAPGGQAAAAAAAKAAVKSSASNPRASYSTAPRGKATRSAATPQAAMMSTARPSKPPATSVGVLTEGAAPTSGLPLRYAGVVDAARAVYHEAGAAGFMRGMTARMALHMPAMAISWTTYETVKRVLLTE